MTAFQASTSTPSRSIPGSASDPFDRADRAGTASPFAVRHTTLRAGWLGRLRRVGLATSLGLACAAIAPSAAAAAGDALPTLEEADAALRAGDADNPSRSRMQLETGIRYENGEGVARDYGRARGYYCEAAKSDNIDALIRLGWLYANGFGVPRNERIAATLFNHASSLGSEVAGQLTMLFQMSSRQMPACLGGDPAAERMVEAPRPATRVGDSSRSLERPTMPTPASFPTSAPPERRKLVELVVQTARQFRLDPRLVLALIGTESGFDPNARSPKNAQGLMQLIPDTAERFAVKDLMDPIENLRGGMSYLRWLLAYYRGDVVLAIAAYNAGEGAVDRFKGVPPYGETIAYVQRIRAFYPFDFHPFDAAATGPSALVRVSRDNAARPVDGASSPGARLPRS